MMNRWTKQIVALALTVPTFLTLASDDTHANTSPAEDYYRYVNEDWLDSTRIPTYAPIIDDVYELSTTINTMLYYDVADMVNGEIPVDTPEMEQFLDLFEIANNWNMRNDLGNDPILPYFENIHALESVEELNDVFSTWYTEGYHLPFRFSVFEDFIDSTQYTVYLDTLYLFLPDKNLYGTDEGDVMLEVFRDTRTELLELYGYDEAEAAELVDLAIEMDEIMAPYMKSAEEMSDAIGAYNPYDYADWTDMSETLDFNQIYMDISETEIDEIIVTSPEYFENFDVIFNDENLEQLKAKLLVELAVSSAEYLTQEHIETEILFEDAMYGIESTRYMDGWYAFSFTRNLFGDALGKYYGQTYFSEEDRDHVTEMAENVIDVYIERLENNDWLSEDTIDQAIVKLEAMELYIGYPDAMPDYYDFITINPEHNLIEFIVEFNEAYTENMFSKLGETVDRDDWGGITADMVNAFYSDDSNGIYFPAAILQYPFYSDEMSLSEQYGGIGAVIGHEISHAFDTRGAQFDQYGSLSNWWTDEDYAAFEERSAAMIELFEDAEYGVSTVNPRMTLNENIADQGGLRVALEALKKDDTANYEEFFESWARVWREKTTDEYSRYINLSAVHAPSPLRVNIQLANMDEFYEAYEIEEDDDMYIPEDERMEIW